MKYYLAGPMTGIPHFNFPRFMEVAKYLRSCGHFVFNPAERDIERHNGVDVSADNPTGSQEAAVMNHKFSLRDALRDDLVFITQEADAIFMMRGWENSKGARAEHATAHALGLNIRYEGN